MSFWQFFIYCRRFKDFFFNCSTQQSAFNKVLLSNAATSALRLHQRLPSFTLSREFLARLMVEDSCHYLVYSLIFFNVQPTLLILLPIVLFAVLHASSYSLKLLDVSRKLFSKLSKFRFCQIRKFLISKKPTLFNFLYICIILSSKLLLFIILKNRILKKNNYEIQNA